MRIPTKTLSTLAAIGLCGAASAGNGTFNLVAGPPNGGSVGTVGYCNSPVCGTQFGTFDTVTLSDGKQISQLIEVGFTQSILLSIVGFTSDPGPNYFNTLSINCQTPLYSHMPGEVASNYWYDATLGAARWSFYRGPWLRCMTGGASYTIVISD